MTYLIFFLGMHWFQKCNFWKKSLSPFWGQVRWGQTASKLKIMKILNENPLRIRIDEIRNLAMATSKMASWPQGSQWIFPKNTFSMTYWEPAFWNCEIRFSQFPWGSEMCRGPNESGPKWVGAQMSWGPNVLGPKWVGAQMCRGPNELGPKCVGAQMSQGPKWVGTKWVRGPNEEWAQMCPSPIKKHNGSLNTWELLYNIT